MDKNLNVFSLWAIDSIDDKEIMKSQLREFSRLGFNGVIFHPRRFSGKIKYLSTQYMAVLSELILFAKSIGLEFWLYDENGWPSGSADGEVIKRNPEIKCQWIENNDGKIVIKERIGINSLDREGVGEFIEITHEGYKKGLEREAFEYVGGFFSDEVGFLEGHGACMDRGAIPWSDEIAQMYDGDIYRRLSELFDEQSSDFKIWYWEALTELLANNFYGQIEKWCKDNGKLYTAHLKGEETPFFQLGYSGSCFQVLKNISVPGIDALGRYPTNKYYSRIASSISKQFGSKIAMAEAIGGAGWGLTPKDLEQYMLWLIRSGINMIVFHINQLHLTYESITDWPSSIPCHQPWKEVFPNVISKMRQTEIKDSELLVICPTRGVTNAFVPEYVKGMNEHDGSNQIVNTSTDISDAIVGLCDRLYENNVEFDLTDEKVFEDNATIKDGKVILGNCSYSKIICSKGCIFTQKGREILANANVTTLQKELSVYIEQSEWKYIAPSQNRYFVEIKNGIGNIKAEHLCDCKVLVSNECSNVTVNGIKLNLTSSSEYGFLYDLPQECLKTGNNVLILDKTEFAYVYVIGDFAVKNHHSYYEYNDRMLCTENGFYISQKDEIDGDFLLSGYAFSDNPIVCEKTVKCTKDGFLRFDCNDIAAGCVYIDGQKAGWVYFGNEYIEISKGTKKIVCEVYQSAFNIYGPHHHLEGDRGLVSPNQFLGKKNFADAMSLPEYTLENKMKFIKWKMKSDIEFSERNKSK